MPPGTWASFRRRPGYPFSAKLEMDLDHKPTQDSFNLQTSLTLGSASDSITPVTEKVTLQIGAFATTIPPGSFTGTGFGPFTFAGVINGVVLGVVIEPTGTRRYALRRGRGTPV